MLKEKTVKVSFGLRESEGQRRLVGLEFQSTGDSTCCASQECALTFAEGAPLFRADSARSAQRALVVDTPWFNSNAQTPSWGRMSTAGLEVVQIMEVLEIVPVPLSKPIVFPTTIDSFHKSREVCAAHLRSALPCLDTHWSMRLVYVPDGETLDSLELSCTKATVFFGKDNLTQAYSWGVVPVPDELASSVEPGRDAVMLCVSSNHPDDFIDAGVPHG